MAGFTGFDDYIEATTADFSAENSSVESSGTVQIPFNKNSPNAGNISAGRWCEFLTGNGSPGPIVEYSGLLFGGLIEQSNPLGTMGRELYIAGAEYSSRVGTVGPLLLVQVSALTRGISVGSSGSLGVTCQPSGSAEGMQAFAFVDTALGAGTLTLSMNYDGDVSVGSTSGNIVTPAASGPKGQMFQAPTAGGGCFLPLTNGDHSVVQINDVTLTGTSTGTIAIGLCRVLAHFPSPAQYSLVERNFITQGQFMPKIVPTDGILGFFVSTAGTFAANSGICGMLSVVIK